MEINFFIFFANSKIVQARLVLCGHAPSGILSGGFSQLLCCLCLPGNPRYRDKSETNPNVNPPWRRPVAAGIQMIETGFWILNLPRRTLRALRKEFFRRRFRRLTQIFVLASPARFFKTADQSKSPAAYYASINAAWDFDCRLAGQPG